MNNSEKEDDDTLKTIIVLKHAEAVDRSYKLNWIDLYDTNGQRLFEPLANEAAQIQTLNDMALPLKLPKREAERDIWLADPPLNIVGILTSTEMGKRMAAMGYNGEKIGNCIYCSPCLCCIETAQNIVTAMGEQNAVVLRVEPSLANWRSQHRFVPPCWTTRTLDEYAKIGKIDKSYQPVASGSDWNAKETLEQLVIRTKAFTDVLSRKHEANAALIIAHGCTIFAMDQALYGQRQKKPNPMSWVSYFRQVPRLASVKYEKHNGGWTYQKSDLPQFPHFPNGRCNWQSFNLE